MARPKLSEFEKSKRAVANSWSKIQRLAKEQALDCDRGAEPIDVELLISAAREIDIRNTKPLSKLEQECARVGINIEKYKPDTSQEPGRPPISAAEELVREAVNYHCAMSAYREKERDEGVEPVDEAQLRQLADSLGKPGRKPQSEIASLHKQIRRYQQLIQDVITSPGGMNDRPKNAGSGRISRTKAEKLADHNKKIEAIQKQIIELEVKMTPGELDAAYVEQLHVSLNSKTRFAAIDEDAKEIERLINDRDARRAAIIKHLKDGARAHSVKLSSNTIDKIENGLATLGLKQSADNDNTVARSAYMSSCRMTEAQESGWVEHVPASLRKMYKERITSESSSSKDPASSARAGARVKSEMLELIEKFSS